jgi:CRISPR system Cascade subunit CasA
MNYLSDRFLPVRCSDGTTVIVSLTEVHVTEDGRTPVAVAFHDNLLSDVSRELIAGVLQVACPPEDESEWASIFKQGPTPDSLRESFAPFVSGFDVFDGSIAFQDRTAADCKEWEVEKLFHASPGDQTRKHNKDFVGGKVSGISVHAAMLALYAIQSHAFACGPGYRVSIAGGGPLRVLPDMGENALP